MHSNFLSIIFSEYTFIFFFDPSFAIMNEIMLYLQEEHVRNKKHIFLYSDMNLYSYLSQMLKTRVNS